MRDVRHVCFLLPARVGAASPVPWAVPLDLGTSDAEAFTELLQVFACGEESAALAFRHIADTRAEAATRAALSVIGDEEAAHEDLLRGLRAALPEPLPDASLRRRLVRFYHGLAHHDAGLHLAAIAALDSAVCGIVGALLRGRAPLAREATVARVLGRIQREEAGHVRLSRGLARDLAGHAAAEVAARTRLDLVAVLALRGAAFDRLGVDPDRLFARLRHAPTGLFA